MIEVYLSTKEQAITNGKKYLLILTLNFQSCVRNGLPVQKNLVLVTCNFKRSKDSFVQKSDIEDSHYQGPFQGVDSLFETLVVIEDISGWVNHLSFELNGSFLLIFSHSNHFKVFDLADGEK